MQWNTGRSYKLDRARHNKSEEYEVPVNKRKRRFKSGGTLVDDKKAMVLSQIKEVHHHADELAKVLENMDTVDAWVVGKMERATTDLSDITHYLDGTTEYAKGGKIVGDIGKSETQYGYTLKEWEGKAEKIGLLVSPKEWWKNQQGKKYKDSFGRTKTIGHFSQDERIEMEYYGYQIAIGMDLGSKKIPKSAIKYVEDNNYKKMADGGMMADDVMSAKIKEARRKQLQNGITLKMYYHETSDGAQYLCSEKVLTPSRAHLNEGSMKAKYVVRIDGAKNGSEMIIREKRYIFGTDEIVTPSKTITSSIKMYFHEIDGAQYLSSENKTYVVRIDDAYKGSEMIIKNPTYIKLRNMADGMMAKGGEVKSKTKKYQILSPDGITIEREVPYYTSKNKAMNAFDKWKENYSRQGYYSSVRYGRIDLSDLADYCQFITL